jgi:hypothetical protein
MHPRISHHLKLHSVPHDKKQMGLVLVGLAGCIFGLAVGMLVSRFHGVYEVFRHVHGRLPTWRSEYVSSLSRDYEFRVLPFLLRVGMLGPYSQSLIDATRHPWLRDNGDALGRINAKEALCKPRSPLRANLPPIPDDLFKDIYIDNSKPWYLLGWHNTERVLKEILSCPKALQSCEQLSITVNRHDRHGFSGLEEASAPPANLPRLLADVLKQMPRVQNFSWSGALDNEEALGVFESAIGYSYMLLPSIKHLQVSPRAYFFAKFAPNLESVTAPDPNPRIPTPNWHVFTYDRAQYLLIDSARTSQNLKTFGMRAVWTPSLVGCVLGALPHIESLYLDGGFWKPLRLLSGVREEQSVGERIKVSPLLGFFIVFMCKSAERDATGCARRRQRLQIPDQSEATARD